MKTPISYYGGKQKMIPWILPKIPEHKTYVEPFFGGGAVFFAKEPSQIEVINDIDSRVYNFWKVTVEHFDELKEMIDLTFHSREIHDTAKKWLNDQDPVKRAWAFWYGTNGAFSNIIGSGYAFNFKDNSIRFCDNYKKLINNMVYKRLFKAYIEKIDAIELIDRWDAPDVFIYEDPPYFNSDCGHYKGYTEDDFKMLLRMNATLKGKFILSCYSSEISDEFIQSNGWRYEDREMHRSAGIDKTGARKIERLIWNYELEKGLFD